MITDVYLPTWPVPYIYDVLIIIIIKLITSYKSTQYFKIHNNHFSSVQKLGTRTSSKHKIIKLKYSNCLKKV